MTQANDQYVLFNLEVWVEGDTDHYVCKHQPGLAFRVEGEDLVFDGGNQKFSFYALCSLMPFLAAKQRPSDRNDWMTTDALFACPDPNCKALFRIKRNGTRTESHSEATREPLE